MLLTDKAIKNAKPKEKQYKLADGGGMYLLVNKKGSKYWRLPRNLFKRSQRKKRQSQKATHRRFRSLTAKENS